MFTRTKIALAAALIVGSASVAMADGEFDPNLGNRYPGYNGPAVTTFQSAPVSLERRGQLRSAPVRLQNQNTFRGTFQEPISHGAGHAPGAFYQQEQPGYPQSPPGGGY
ncbi:MAG TPA: hypothetical protein VJT13_24420 [Xanthobacteraceae bacterium]|nr:hypothetical protein [Xanthobacteraceae bacterium]